MRNSNPINMYIVISEKVYRLYNVNNRLTFMHGDEMIVYTPELDGPAVSREVVSEQYPEFLI